LDWAAFSRQRRWAELKIATAPEFGIEPVLWWDTAFLAIDEHLASTLWHPAKRCTGMKKMTGLGSYRTHADHATDSCYRPSFEVLVVVVVVMIEVIERECLNTRSVK
jgi:hypothetical protein